MKITKDNRLFTREPYHNTMTRTPQDIFSLWVAASAKLGISRAAFLRKAIKAEALKTLADDRSAGE